MDDNSNPKGGSPSNKQGGAKSPKSPKVSRSVAGVSGGNESLKKWMQNQEIWEKDLFLQLNEHGVEVLSVYYCFYIFWLFFLLRFSVIFTCFSKRTHTQKKKKQKKAKKKNN